MISLVYIKSKKGQNWLFPPSIRDMIPKDHICLLVESFVENLDFSRFDTRYAGAGHPAYHPKIALKILVQGLLDKVRSSRRLEKACQENNVYLYLSEKLNPNFRTISRFRKENEILLEETFKETVRLAQSLNLVSVEMFCTDGSKIKANAGKKNAMKRKNFDVVDEWVKNEIEQGIAQDEYEDKLEEELGLKDKPKPDRQEIRRKVKEYIKKMRDEKGKDWINKKHQAVRAQLAKKDLKSVSLTDPESRFMKSKKGHYELSYNIQTTVDSKHGIIVASDVCQETNDTRQGRPQLEQAEANLGQLPEGLKVCMDADYDDPATLKWLEDKKFDAYIPLAEKGGKAKNEEFSKKYFVYNEKTDTFTCPKGKNLPFKSTSTDKNGSLRKNYHNGKACWSCPARPRCVGKGERRTITATFYEASIRRMKTKMQLPESKQIYDKRKEVSELAYAHIKHNMQFTEFLTRSLKTVKGEFKLACAASNLRRIWNQIKHIPNILERVSQQTPKFFWRSFYPA